MSGRVRLLLAALIVVSMIAVPFAAMGQSGGEAGTTPSADEYSLSELQNGGEVVDERYPSLRTAGDYTAFWMVRYPPRGMGSYGDRGSQQFIEPSSTVQRQKVRMYASFPFDGETRNFTVTKVYWTRDSKTVQTDNGTTTESVANISAIDQQTLQYQSGMRRTQEVSLRGYYDQATRVTVFLGLPDGDRLRWTFNIKTIPTAEPVSIDSRGDLYEFILLFVILPTLLVVWLVDKKVSAFRRSALAGTGHGPGFWIAIGTVMAAVAYTTGYYATASLTAALPFVFPLLVGWVVGAFRLEDDDDAVETWGFVKMDPETAASPLKEKAEILDSAEIEVRGFDVVHTPEDKPALYSKGLLSMWARSKGKYATIDIENKEAEWEGVGDYDKIIVVDQDAPDLVEHLPERVIWKFPWRTYTPPTDEDGDIIEDAHDAALFRALPQELDKSTYIGIAGMVLTPIAAAFLSHEFVGAWQWGPIACAPLILRYAEPIEGEARAYAAPGQARKAWTTAWYADINMKRFATIDQLAKALLESEERKYNVEEWLNEFREEGVIDSANDSDSDPFDYVMSEDDPATTAKNGTSNDTGAD
ncbi:hypothetical protein [Haloplanus salilacus]|uniref:hypothetical protein n=1 Tax=Haloplanus salilacus TaxID=2949994 RepID=UPI0030CB0F4A